MFRTGEILLSRQGALHSLNSELCQNGRVSRTDLLSGQRSPAEVGRDGCLDGPGNLIAAQGRERGRETFLPVVRLYQAGVAATPFPHRGHPLGSLPPFPPRPRLDRGTGLDPEVQKGLLHFPFVRRAELHLRKVDTSKQSNLVDEDHVRTSVGLPEVLLMGEGQFPVDAVFHDEQDHVEAQTLEVPEVPPPRDPSPRPKEAIAIGVDGYISAVSLHLILVSSG